MLYKSTETCHPVSLPCKGTNILIFVTCGASFYLRAWSVQPPIQCFIPMGEMYLHARMFYTLAHTSLIPTGAINFYMQECFLHLLIPLLFKCSYIFYSHGCNVRAWNLFWASLAKLVLSNGWNKFLHARTFFTFADTIAPIFTMLTKVLSRANRAMVTNN